VASEAYWKYLAKKKENEGEPSMSAIESLAMVMVAHGEEFGDQSAYGELVLFGFPLLPDLEAQDKPSRSSDKHTSNLPPYKNNTLRTFERPIWSP
jgi:hypothetical protein